MSERNLPPEPGEVDAPDLGIPGPAEPMPEDDAERDEPTQINDDDGPDDGDES